MDTFRRNVWLSIGTLLSSVTTLVCCVLPAMLVALGAGAAVVGLVSAVPQLVWLSEHKTLVFGFAIAMLAINRLALVRARHLPCPADPELAGACQRVRAISNRLFYVAAALVGVGAFVAFALPAIIA